MNTETTTPTIDVNFPESLPVSARREEIMAAMRAHQVVIVCGETGSGKTTQLPKMAWLISQEMRRAAEKNPVKPARKTLIGHTQPRRLAATSVAKRLAQELQTPLGDFVGYKIRFNDRMSAGTRIKLMTDGILLAETQTDPELRAYDTLIIDEAHERSLNIDFLLGYLKQLLPRRPDLRIVITSATIDADRFARHFESIRGPAPVLMVSGRLFPVEQRYRPFEESREFDAFDAIAQACEELLIESPRQGDVLVFLPGEREIKEAETRLRKQLAHVPSLRNTEVLPLYARLSQAEQDRVFETSHSRRVVLATNVAETSLTVPGIRYVVDVGTARVKRYSFRNKVEQLLVEPISQAASNQRAGRCGRVSDGVCIRLYDEKEFAARAPFTDPEILRSSLAGVILRMKSLRLGAVEDFPFVERPSSRAIADGYQLLQELGAVDEANELTPLGAQLAKLPLDPRVSRMLWEAKERAALDDMLVIASALSVQDVRDRPQHAQAQADAAHHAFDDEKSEFVGYLKLWKWLREARGGHVDSGDSHKLSNRQYENLLRERFISVRRVREWRDVHSQLVQTVQEQHWKINNQPASYEALHLSLLAGFVGNVGCKSDDEDWYLGTRGIKFWPHPGRNLSKKPGRWLVAAELVETTRLFGRALANIEPAWIERAAGHLIKAQLLDPHWSKSSGEVVALERGTLYGLVIYNNRRVSFSRIDPSGARDIFIRQALVGGEWTDEMARLAFLPHNAKMIRQVEDLEHKSRRQDVLVDDELIYAFYDRLLPEDVCSSHTLAQWYRHETQSNPDALKLSRDELMRHEAAGVTSQAFPKLIRLGGVDCSAVYLHEPGDARDGVTVTLPLIALNQVSEDRCEWLVPGMLKDKLLALLKSLPQRPRSRLVPLPQSAESLTLILSEPEAFAHGDLIDALLKRVREVTQLDVKRSDFKPDQLQPHHRMNFRLIDDNGRQLAQGRSLAALRAEWGSKARGAFAELAKLQLGDAATESAAVVDMSAGDSPSISLQKNAAHVGEFRSSLATNSVANSSSIAVDARHSTWSFGELPELLEVQRGRQMLVGFPALVDDKDAVRIEVFDEPELAAVQHRAGVRRLVALQIKDALKYLEKNLPDLQRMSLLYANLGTSEELRDQILDVAIDRAFLADALPHDEASFKLCVEQGRARLTLIANEVARLAHSILTELSAAQRKLKDSKPSAEVAGDVQTQLGKLCGKFFVRHTPYPRLAHFARYLKAITLRLDKLRADPVRDAQRMAELKPIEQRFWRLMAERKGQWDERSEDFRYLLEELRVSLFAQELRTPTPVSVKRLDKAWAGLVQ